MQFKYKAQTKGGMIKEGIAEAGDKFSLSKNLKKKGLIVVSVSELKHGGSSFLTRLNESVITIKLKEKIFFASNLSEMVGAGLPLTRALDVLARQSTNQRMKRIIDEIQKSIDSGQTFSSALAKHPDIFSTVFVAMAEAGEKSGKLPAALKLVGDQLQKSYDLRRKIKGALMYPAVIVVAMMLVGTAMLIYVVPTLAETFDEIGAELPFTTRAVIWFADFLKHNYVYVGIGLFIFIYLFIRLLKTKVGQKASGFVLLHLPVTRKLTIHINAAATTRTLSALVSSGVDLVESIRITEHVIRNPYYKNVLVQAGKEVPKGIALSKIFGKYERYYPPFVGEMISVGEETGKHSEMLLKLANYYEGEVDSATKNMSTIIEPVVMIMVGIAVGFFALSMIQPIYSIGTNL